MPPKPWRALPSMHCARFHFARTVAVLSDSRSGPARDAGADGGSAAVRAPGADGLAQVLPTLPEGVQVIPASRPDDLTRALAEGARRRLVRQAHPLLFWKDLGRYLLLAAALPMLLLFGRRQS